MKKSIVSMLVFLVVLSASAAEGEWLTSLPEALKRAKKESKVVLMDFTGSDWCPPCRALSKSVFSSKDFRAYAKDKLILVELDYPARKKQGEELKKANEALQRKYKVRQFPTVVVVNAEGDVIHRKEGYGGDAKGYLAKLKEALEK